MKKFILPAATIGVIALAITLWYGTATVNAAGSNHDTLIDKIAQKFNLPADQVKTVFDEEKAARQEDRRVEQNAKLDQAVIDGVITKEQQDLIIAKRAELAEGRAERRSEMQSWMADNGIDETKLAPYLRKGMEFGRHHAQDN